MKTTTTLLAVILTACFSFSATAQQSVAGSWQAESVSSVKPPKGASLTLAFGDEGQATITYTLGGQSQSWQYRYAVSDNQLTLEPTKPFGKPKPITFDIKFDEGKLLLLTPKPKPAEEDATEEATGEDAQEEEEDTRVPVWVLIKP